MEDNNKYYKSRHFLRLLHRYEKAVSEGHVPYLEADELTDIAEYYMTDKQDAKANQAIQAAIDMHPGSVDPQIFLARQKMFYGQIDEARAIVDAITEQEDLEVIYIRAELFIKEGRTSRLPPSCWSRWKRCKTVSTPISTTVSPSLWTTTNGRQQKNG